MIEIPDLYQHYLNSKGVCTDSRIVQAGHVFFALKGESFDGNRFAIEALRAGALLAVVDDPSLPFQPGLVVVDDTLRTLQELARFHRQHLPYPIVALTGSNGKTSSKELTVRVLQAKFSVGFTQGNLNNHIGVPQTILSFGKDLDIGIVEMGANHHGEIDLLSSIALPDAGFITNIGKAHLEGFGDLEGVFRGKTELIPWLEQSGGTFFLNNDDPFLRRLNPEIPVITYGVHPDSQLRAELLSADPFVEVRVFDEESGPQIIRSRMAGAYNLSNVLVAYAVGRYFGVSPGSIVEAIESYAPENNRSQWQESVRNTLILDAYNANPSSMEAALRNLHQMSKDKAVLPILGDMFELGDSAPEEHRALIELVAELGFPRAIFIGPRFTAFSEEFKQYTFFSDTDTAVRELAANPPMGKLILLKGSRGMKLELIIPYL